MRLLISTLLLLAWSAFGATVPLKNALLQSDMNAGGFQLTNVTAIIDPSGNAITADGARLVAGDFTIAVKGDMHGGQSDGLFIGDSAAGVTLLSNSFNTIISLKTNLNIVALLSAGDNVDLSSDVSQWQFLTNQILKLRTNGISWITCPGNHETSGSPGGTNWDYFIGTNFFLGDRLFRTNFSGTPSGGTLTSSTRQSVSTYTNGSSKFAFISISYGTSSWAPAPDITWIGRMAAQYSDHICFVVCHFYGAYAGEIKQWGQRADEIRKSPNIAGVFSGHYRDPFAWRVSKSVGYSGNVINEFFMNTQQMTNSGGNYIRFFTFSPKRNQIFINTYDDAYGGYITNYQGSYLGSGVGCSNGVIASESVPISMSVGNSQRLRLQGSPAAFGINTNFNTTNGANSQVSYTNNLLDTEISLQGVDGTFTPTYLWALGTDVADGTNRLQLRYMTWDGTISASHVAPTIGYWDAQGNWHGGWSSFPASNAPFAALTNFTMTFSAVQQSNQIVSSGATTTAFNSPAWVLAPGLGNGLVWTNVESSTKFISNNGSYFEFWRNGSMSWSNATLFGVYGTNAGTGQSPTVYAGGTNLILGGLNYNGTLQLNQLGTIYPSNGLTMAQIAADLKNGDHWNGPMSNGFWFVYKTNNATIFTNIWGHP